MGVGMGVRLDVGVGVNVGVGVHVGVGVGGCFRVFKWMTYAVEPTRAV